MTRAAKQRTAADFFIKHMLNLGMSKTFKNLPNELHQVLSNQYLTEDQRSKVKDAFRFTYIRPNYEATQTSDIMDIRRDIIRNGKLHKALLDNDTDLAKIYVNALGPDLLSDVADRKTPITIAIQRNDLYMVKYIAKRLGTKGLDKERKLDRFQASPLSLAASYGRLDMVKYLVAIMGRDAVLRDKNKFGDTPLAEASIQGHIDVVKFLVDVMGRQGLRDAINEDLKYSSSHTPLYYASVNNHPDIVEYLVKVIGPVLVSQDVQRFISEPLKPTLIKLLGIEHHPNRRSRSPRRRP